MKPENRKRVLIVEDDTHIAEGLRLNLTLQGYETATAGSGTEALQLWKSWNPDLIVLDIMLPALDGLSVLRHIRLSDERLPVLILSAKGAPDDRVRGFSCGVDDYLAKPFNLEEFLLRVERLLTRACWGLATPRDPAAGAPLESYAFGGHRIDFRELTVRGPLGEIQLTEQEARLLKLFITHRGQVLSRKTLLALGWGYAGATTTRTVDSFLVRLRKYFETDPGNPVYFRSVRSVGYLFDHPDEPLP